MLTTLPINKTLPLPHLWRRADKRLCGFTPGSRSQALLIRNDGSNVMIIVIVVINSDINDIIDIIMSNYNLCSRHSDNNNDSDNNDKSYTG